MALIEQSRPAGIYTMIFRGYFTGTASFSAACAFCCQPDESAERRWCICTYNLIVISFLFWAIWCSRHCPFVCLSNSNDLCYSHIQIQLNCLLATGDSVCFVTFWYFYTPSWSLSGIYAWPVHVQSFRTHPRIWMTVTETRFRDDNQAIQWKHASVETI